MVDKQLRALKKALQAGEPKLLERLAADLVTKLVGVRFTVANSGFQHGSDAGSSGRAGRHLHLECKRYADKSPLDDRNLRGEIDDALKQDAALEAWVLVSTRGVSQQTESSLKAKTESTGVPIIVIDWREVSVDLPTLAALCAWHPDAVGKHYGKEAKADAKALATIAGPIVERLIHELSPWGIGFGRLVDRAAERFNRMWSSTAESKSEFGQNIAGGLTRVVERQSVSNGLDAWWKSDSNSTAVVHGAEGMGKTWATLLWAHAKLDSLPIFLILPSSAFRQMRGCTHASVGEFLGDALHDLNPGTSRSYWQLRLERLLQRPLAEGPVILLLVDGVNQEPSFEWKGLLQFLEGDRFSGRLRVLITVQTHYLRENLLGLRSLPNPSTQLEVGPYDISEGGEFDNLLLKHGLRRDALSQEMIGLARVPRMFELTLRLNANATLQGALTPGRLLWAHARDEFGLKAGASLSESDWENWLSDIAKQYQQDVIAGKSLGQDETGYSTRELGDMVRDAAGSPDETARRLQEIVSGRWLEEIPGRTGHFRPTEATIHFALGIALLGMLNLAEQKSTHEAARVLNEYLDAIGATSAAAVILASALSVLVEKKWRRTSVIPKLILSSLLQSQNASDGERMHAVQLAPALVEPLLFVAEDARSRATASARHWALTALHGIPAANTSAWKTITNQMVGWVAHATCPAPEKVVADNEATRHEVKLLVGTVGTAKPGVHLVVGVPMRLHELERNDLGEYVPQLLLQKPLVPSIKVFVAAAVAAAVARPGKVWSGLKWLVTLNPVDRDALQTELIRLSETAKVQKLECGVHADVLRLVSCFLLWLTGDEHQELNAYNQRVTRPEQFSYEKDYLDDPAQSYFALEFRHMELIWSNPTTSVLRKLERAQAFLPSPSVIFPKSIKQKILEWGQSFDFEKLNSHRSFTSEDHQFETILPLASRVSPSAVGDFVARWVRTFGGRQDERRSGAAFKLPRFALLIGPDDVDVLQAMRLRRPKIVDEQERFVLLSLLESELMAAPVDLQLDTLVQEQSAFISITLADVLRPPHAETVKNFIHRWGLKNIRAVEVLCTYLWKFPSSLEDKVFDQLLEHALSTGDGNQTLAFMALSVCRPQEFGQALLDARWKALPSANEYLQEFGSKAVLAASATRPLSEVSDFVAPWCLLDEAALREETPEELEAAVKQIERALLGDGLVTFPNVAHISVSSQGLRNSISIEPSRQVSDEDNEFNFLDSDTQWERHQAARKTGEAYLRAAKSAGAVMSTRVVSSYQIHICDGRIGLVVVPNATTIREHSSQNCPVVSFEVFVSQPLSQSNMQRVMLAKVIFKLLKCWAVSFRAQNQIVIAISKLVMRFA
jgi:hypothetical protein